MYICVISHLNFSFTNIHCVRLTPSPSLGLGQAALVLWHLRGVCCIHYSAHLTFVYPQTIRKAPFKSGGRAQLWKYEISPQRHSSIHPPASWVTRSSSSRGVLIWLLNPGWQLGGCPVVSRVSGGECSSNRGGTRSRLQLRSWSALWGALVGCLWTTALKPAVRPF